MPIKPKNDIDALLTLLSLLQIKSATKVLANRNSINSMIGVLKELYDPVITQQLVYGNNPFLALIPKSQNSFTGKYIPVMISKENK